MATMTGWQRGGADDWGPTFWLLAGRTIDGLLHSRPEFGSKRDAYPGFDITSASIRDWRGRQPNCRTWVFRRYAWTRLAAARIAHAGGVQRSLRADNRDQPLRAIEDGAAGDA